jgi:multiple sugar transport system permease protein
MKEAKGLRRLLIFLILLLASIIVLAPFLWICLNSLKYQIDIYEGGLKFKPNLENYHHLFFSMKSDFLLNLKNSLVVAAGCVVAVITVGCLTAYSLARYKWSKFVSVGFMGWILVFHMVPPITLVGPWYIFFHRIGLYNTNLALILGHIALNLALAIWIIRSFMEEVPKEVLESARIDGCTDPQILSKIVLPLITSGLVATGTLTFMFSWNEFAVALSLTGTEARTIPVGIANYAQENQIRYGQMAAASVLATIPAIALVSIFQRYIVSGLTLGAVKG